MWSIGATAPWGKVLATFFLGCVVVAGVVGGLTAARSILVVQAAPAAVALALVVAG